MHFYNCIAVVEIKTSSRNESSANATPVGTDERSGVATRRMSRRLQAAALDSTGRLYTSIIEMHSSARMNMWYICTPSILKLLSLTGVPKPKTTKNADDIRKDDGPQETTTVPPEIQMEPSGDGDDDVPKRRSSARIRGSAAIFTGK